MTLPISPPFAPMEALPVLDIPGGDQWQYEPKWDGFRCLVFKDRTQVELQSKKGESLNRYFPELLSALHEVEAHRFVLDGEIVVPAGAIFSFDDLLQRIHPAESRIKRLAKERPAKLIVFDLLVAPDGKSRLDSPLRERRPLLEEFFSKSIGDDHPRIQLSPATPKIEDARRWLEMAGGMLDGIIAKRADLGYQSGQRTGMQKIKNLRTADCVVGGFRYATKQRVLGSLLLGLYDDQGLLNHVGFTSSFTQQERKSLLKKVEPLIKPPGFTGNAPGGPSRWSTERSAEWQPLEPKLVVEVQYDHFTGNRFRHGTKILRWRPDKAPEACSMDQVVPVNTKGFGPSASTTTLSSRQRAARKRSAVF
jgi:ATP-dependent DNA ligase